MFGGVYFGQSQFAGDPYGTASIVVVYLLDVDLTEAVVTRVTLSETLITQLNRSEALVGNVSLSQTTRN